jgi:AcrR family transcriptional regulator
MIFGQLSSSPAASGAKADKRQVILKAAWKLIRHYGYSKVTISDIAKGAGTGKGTIYLYFRSKDEIMLALVDMTNERITRDLEKIAASGGPPQDRLRECLLHRIMTIYDLVHRYPHGEDVITSIKPEIVKRIDRHVEGQAQLLARILGEGDFAKAVEDPGTTALTLAGLFELLTPPYYRFRSRKSLERFANQVMDLLLNGLYRRDGRTPARP